MNAWRACYDNPYDSGTNLGAPMGVRPSPDYVGFLMSTEEGIIILEYHLAEPDLLWDGNDVEFEAALLATAEIRMEFLGFGGAL